MPLVFFADSAHGRLQSGNTPAVAPVNGRFFFGKFPRVVLLPENLGLSLLFLEARIVEWAMAEHAHIVLAVERDTSGVYRRLGRLCISKALWEASDPVTQVIELG